MLEMAGPGALGEPVTLSHNVCVCLKDDPSPVVLAHGEQPSASGGDGEQDKI